MNVTLMSFASFLEKFVLGTTMRAKLRGKINETRESFERQTL